VSGKGTPAMLLLEREGVAHVVHVVHAYTLEGTADAHAKSYGQAAAAALGVEPERMLKTLLATVDGTLVCGVVPVAGTLDLKALAGAVGGKRGVMADPAVAERSTGYVVGGISPLGQRTRLPTVVDETAGLWDTVVVSAGRRGLSVELAPDDLVRLTSAVVADVAR
jgi:Cys-tRNA(Pro)/Cys-tRNA(Cys) deacylase